MLVTFSRELPGFFALVTDMSLFSGLSRFHHLRPGMTQWSGR